MHTQHKTSGGKPCMHAHCLTMDAASRTWLSVSWVSVRAAVLVKFLSWSRTPAASCTHTKQKDLNIKKLAKLKDAQAQMRSCPCLEVRNQGKSGKGAGMALLQAKELNAALCKTCALQALPPCETV